MKLRLAFFHFLSIFSLLCSNSASAQCLHDQKSSLLTLFGSAPTPFWTPSTDCCLWKGITCDRSGHVTGLDLTSHSISAPINSTSLTFLSSLRIFNLSDNALTGNIPLSLFRLPTLQYLNLSNNLFDAPLDEFNLPSSSLKSLDLSNNSLQGPIPTSLFQLRRLRTLSLSSNNFNGTVDLFILQNIKNLSSLDLSNNRLSINTSGINTSFPQIGNLKLSSCNLREFPDFLRNQLRLSTLDLSNNKIDGEIPNWVWRIGNGSLKYLKLSHNMLYGFEPHTVDLSLSKLSVLDLHSNKLQGTMPIPPPSTFILDYSSNGFTSSIPTNISLYLNFTVFFSLSKNNISGEIPPSICAANNLIVLDLSLNNLSGSIPTCLGQLDNLLVLNLGTNNFRGVIPQSFQHGCSLRTLNLNGNLLEGALPKSLANCTQLEVLNIGNNQINDSFPSWFGSLKQLRVLILRSNKFFGPIQHPEDQNAFSQLRMIDLSSNSFTGKLSSEWFLNLKAMIDDEVKNQSLIFGFFDDLNWPEYYQYNAIVTLKGLEIELLNIPIFLTSLDLSWNRFHGSIPEDIGNLKSLHVLNMSHNDFNGSIPTSFGNLKSLHVLNMSHNDFNGSIPPSFGNLEMLESLDLSMNQLSGEIPTNLTDLTFLSFLNLSYNSLMGRIPFAGLFSTFPDSSFQGNPGLCGILVSRQCEVPPDSLRFEAPSQNDSRWKYISIELGFVVGFWTVMGPLLFWKRGRRWYYKHVDNIFSVLLLWWDTYVMAIIKPKQSASGRMHGSASGPTDMMDDDFTIWTWMEERSLE